MSNTLALIIQLVSGALGGNGAGAILKKLSLGTIFNSIVGILGGGLGGWLMKLLNISIGSGGADIGSILGNVAAGGVGGGALMVIIGGIKKLISK